MSNIADWTGVAGVVLTSWISVTPLVAGSIIFFSRTKSAIKGFDVHIDYFKEKFQVMIEDIKSLQEKQQEISLEIGPVKKNGSIVTSDELNRRLNDFNHKVNALEASVLAEIQLLVKVTQNNKKYDDIDHKFSEELITKIAEMVKKNG